MNAVTQALSAALIHIVWQSALIVLVLWIALIVLKNRSAQVRYAVNCVALFVLAMTFIVAVVGVVYLNASPSGLPALSSVVPASVSTAN